MARNTQAHASRTRSCRIRPGAHGMRACSRVPWPGRVSSRMFEAGQRLGSSARHLDLIGAVTSQVAR